MTIYEIGAVLASGVDWGVIAALKDGLHNLVKAFNAVIRGLGVLIPVLVVLAVVAFIVYRICLILVRRNRERRRSPLSSPPARMGQSGGFGRTARSGRSGPGRRRTDRRTAGTCCPICIHYLTVCRLGRP